MRTDGGGRKERCFSVHTVTQREPLPLFDPVAKSGRRRLHIRSNSLGRCSPCLGEDSPAAPEPPGNRRDCSRAWRYLESDKASHGAGLGSHGGGSKGQAAVESPGSSPHRESPFRGIGVYGPSTRLRDVVSQSGPDGECIAFRRWFAATHRRAA